LLRFVFSLFAASAANEIHIGRNISLRDSLSFPFTPKVVFDNKNEMQMKRNWQRKSPLCWRVKSLATFFPSEAQHFRFVLK